MKIGNLDVYGVIYKITNKINGKNYIGQTILGFSKRYSETEWWAKVHNEHLKSSIKKYGINNFEVFEIYDIAFSKSELDVKEICYIDLLKSNNRIYGYNKKDGGANGKHSKESLIKMSMAHRGIKLSYKTKRKMSETRKGMNLGEKNPMYGKNPLSYMSKEDYSNLMRVKSKNMTAEKNPMYGRYAELNGFYGKKHTEQSKEIISEKAKARYKNRKNNPNSKEIIMNTSEDVFVEKFDSFRGCSEWLLSNNIIKNVRTGDDAISRSIKNNKPYKGYMFKYVD